MLTENLDNGDKVYYDRTAIKQLSPTVFVVTTKVVPEQQTREKIIKAAQKAVPNLYEKYKMFRYSVQENEINCNKHLHWLKFFADYDSKNRIIESQGIPLNWRTIPPRSLDERIYQFVCKK